MAQVQTSRLPMNGPSWDEEVVPALRKRLEIESLTLARRISAISLSSQDDHSASIPADSASTSTYTAPRDTPSTPYLQSNASTSARSQYQQPDTRTSLDRIPTSSSRVPNGVTSNPSKRTAQSPSPTPLFQRSRTYSQPYLTEFPNGKSSRSKPNMNTHSHSKPTRIPDPKPTRIPQPAARSSPSLALGTYNPGNSSIPAMPNGNYQYTSTTLTQEPYGHASAQLPTPIPRNNIKNSMNTGLGILHEPPPFNPASASSSITPSSDSDHDYPVRPSIESEEHPFEHWYRGEVSRNGGVGELRVGRRQEMLDIANYGHTIRAREGEWAENKRRRKRADSVSGTIGLGEVAKEVDKERKRESLYLDDYDSRDAERVLDEVPLTDLEGSDARDHDIYGSHEDLDEDRNEVGLLSNHRAYDTTRPDARSITPTSFTQTQQGPSPRSPNAPPSRIPARSRQSSESRIRSTSETSLTSPNLRPKSTSPPPTRHRQHSKPTPAGGRAASKTRTPASKATRAKTLASKKEMEDEAKRRSVAYYPTPGEGDEMMIDAIPEWTQPVPRQGNWDEVVLPVVARKKGLEEHYEKADGKPTPRKLDTIVAPAPGTFGFDHSKYRPPRGGKEPDSIPMDEFGLPTPQVHSTPLPAEDRDPSSINASTTKHHQVFPERTAHSPPPFSDYVVKPTSASGTAVVSDMDQSRQDRFQENDEGGGCCKCIIM